MTDFNRIDGAIAANMSRSIEELSRLCAQPSIAAQGAGMAECAELVAELLRARDFSVEILPSEGYPVVCAERDGRSDRTLLFYNHYDVQPAEPFDLWESPPFEPAIRDGKMYARGVSDDKGHIICRLAALDAFLAVESELPCKIKFIIEGEEEVGSVHLPEFVRANADRLEADACVWEFGGVNDQGDPVQYAGLRGICYVELSVETALRDAHSGLGGSIFPNAAWRLTWALNTLKGPDERIRLPGFYDKVKPPSQVDLDLIASLPDNAAEYTRIYGIDSFLKGLEPGPELRREAVFSPTCTICGLTSGYQGPGTKTVLPARASAKVDFRLVPDQHPEEVLEQLRRHLDREGFEDVRIDYLGGEPPARTDPSDPFLQMVVQTAEDVYGRPQIIAPLSGASGPNHAFVHGLNLPVATAGVGYPESNAHAPNENMVLDLFEKGVRHTARIISGFAAMEAQA